MNIETPNKTHTTDSSVPQPVAMTETTSTISPQNKYVNFISSITLDKDQVIIQFTDRRKIVQFTLENTTFQNAVCDPSGKVALKVAALQGNLEAVHALREAGVIVDPTINEKGIGDKLFTLISSPRAAQYVDEMRAHIEAGFDLTMRDNEGRTLLMAVLQELSEVQEELKYDMEEEEYKNLRDKEKSLKVIVDVLIEEARTRVNKPDILNASVSSTGETALILALKTGSVGIVKKLKEAGADITFPDREGSTPLMHAILSNNSLEKVEVLTEGGTNSGINASGPGGRTALMLAAMKYTLEDFEKIFSLLIEAGADINARDSSGRTALMLAAQRGISPEVLQKFVNAGADINACDSNGCTALKLAAKNEKLSALFKARDSDGCTAIMLAAENGNLDLLQSLLMASAEAGIDIEINAADNSGYTALMYAIVSEKNSLEMVQALIKGAGNIDIDACDHEGDTALMLAIALDNNPTIIDLLVKRGAHLQFATELLDRQELAHKWGIGETTEIRYPSGEIKKFKVEGMYKKHALRILSKDVKSFFQIDKSAISNDDRVEIQECIENAYPLKKMVVSETVKKINNVKPFMILGGTQKHAVAIVVRGKELFVCNRGEGSWAYGSQRFLLSSDIDETMLLELTKVYSSMDEFNRMIQQNKKLTPAGGVQQEKQGVENCALASGKAAFAVFCLLYSGYTSWDQEVTPKVGSIDRGGKVYKRFGTYLRTTKLKQYLEKFKKSWFTQVSQKFQKSPPPQLQRADDILIKIQGKCSKKGLEFKEIQAMLSGMQLA